jgi:hypothetical protein
VGGAVAAGAAKAAGGAATGGVVGAVAGAIAGVAGLGTAIVQAKSMREQSKADERMYRMQMLQSKQDSASSSQMIKVGLVQAKQQADAQAKIAKTVVMGLGAVVVLGGLLWIGKDLLKD